MNKYLKIRQTIPQVTFTMGNSVYRKLYRIAKAWDWSVPELVEFLVTFGVETISEEGFPL